MSTTDSNDRALPDLVDGIRIAMVTTGDGGGELHSRPLTVQRVDADGTVWFLVSEQTPWLTAGALGPVNVAFSGGDTWVSVCGHASVVRDEAILADLGDPVSSAWFDDEHPPVALKVDGEHADYWDGPGKVAQVLKLAKAAVTQKAPDMGERGSVEL